MDVTKQLVKDFVEVTGGTSRTNTNVYGTLVKNGNSICVRIDGSDEITPINASLVALPETIDEDDPDRVTLEVKNHQTVVTGNLKNKAIGTEQGEQYQTGIGKLENTINGLTYTDNDGVVRISRGSIVLTGTISWSDFTDSGAEFNTVKKQASDAYGLADDASTAAGEAYNLASSANGTASSVLNTVNGWKYSGTTKIDGRSLVTDTVTASKLRGGSVSILDTNGNPMAVITPQRTSNNGLTIATTNTDSVENIIKRYGSVANALAAGAITSSDLYPIRLIARGNLYLENTTDEGNVTTLQFTQSSFDSAIAVSASYFLGSGSGTDLGASNRKWKNVYVLNDSASTSDRNEKHDIEDLPEKYLNMFDDLHVYRFKLNEGTSDRYHVGFVAQDVFDDAMTPNGIDSQEFGGFVKDTDPETGRDIYMLRYSEFIGLLVAKVQQHEKRLSKLES